MGKLRQAAENSGVRGRLEAASRRGASVTLRRGQKYSTGGKQGLQRGKGTLHTAPQASALREHRRRVRTPPSERGRASSRERRPRPGRGFRAELRGARAALRGGAPREAGARRAPGGRPLLPPARLHPGTEEPEAAVPPHPGPPSPRRPPHPAARAPRTRAARRAAAALTQWRAEPAASGAQAAGARAIDRSERS